MADQIASLNGFEAFSHVARLLSLRIEAAGLEYIPKRGRLMVIANHPTGLADGVAVFDALKAHRPDLMFMANADALRVVPKGQDIIIPVEWVLEKRTRKTARDTLRGIKAAMEEERCVVIFPAGKLAQLTLSGLKDAPWQSSAASLARKFNAPVVPLHIEGRNSALYYLFCLLNDELRDITLFNELLNKAGHLFSLEFGPVIPAEQLPKSAVQASNFIRHVVTHELAVTE